MLKMFIFNTNSSEDEILLRLIGRGRHADSPYYQSVSNYEIDKGIVIFSRLDCEPAQPYKVGVAGSKIIATESFAPYIKAWLSGWGIGFTVKRKTVKSKEAAQSLFSKMRKETDEGREAIIEKAWRGLRAEEKD